MIELPSCSATAARALSDLAPRLPVHFTVAGRTLAATLLIGDRPHLPDDWPRVGARFATHQVTATFAADLLPQAAVAHWPEIEQVGVPDGLRDILRDVLLAELADSVSGWAGEAPRWTPTTAPEPLPHALLVTQAESSAPVALVEFDERGLAWLAGRCTGWPLHAVMIDALTLPLTLLVDRIVIGRSELAGLLPRDVVLLDQSPVDAAGAVAAILCMPGFPGFRTRIAGGRASLESPVDAAMDTPSPPPAASIDEVPLVIECDVGRISLTIARLRELSPGQVLDLGFDATSRVTLRLNGQPIATGELVRIAERTGVRITDVLLSRLA